MLHVFAHREVWGEGVSSSQNCTEQRTDLPDCGVYTLFFLIRLVVFVFDYDIDNNLTDELHVSQRKQTLVRKTTRFALLCTSHPHCAWAPVVSFSWGSIFEIRVVFFFDAAVEGPLQPRVQV